MPRPPAPQRDSGPATDRTDSLLIGRSRRCDVTIREKRISRRHCRLESRGGGYFLRDLGSANGTWVDGERVGHAYLQTGDRFVVGDTVLRIARDGSVSEEGRAHPRTVRDTPTFRSQVPALAMLAVPVIGGTLLVLALAKGQYTPPAEGTSVGTASLAAVDDAPPVEPPAIDVTDATGASESEADSSAATIESPAASGGDATPERAAPPDPLPRYDIEELLAIAATVDRELSDREEEMASLLGEPAAASDTTIDSTVSSTVAPVPARPVVPPPLEESWSGIVGKGSRTSDAEPVAARPDAAAEPAPRIVAARAPVVGPLVGPDLPPSAPPGRARPPTAVDETSRGGGGTEVAELPAPVGPLFPESARREMAEEFVIEGIGLIDRYHVRAVSHEPIVPLVVQLRDLGGAPAAEGLLVLRGHTREKLRTVHARVRKLSRDAKQSEKDLAGRPRGGAEERTDELTLRLAALVGEQLETLVLIRDTIDRALLDEGLPLFVVETLLIAIDEKDLHLYERTLASARSHGIRETIPILIDAIGSSRAELRAGARVTLEHITGERPGTTRRAWREWWQAQGAKETEA